MAENKLQLFVLLENLRSAYNVGSIFRTCDSAAVDRLFLSGYTPYPPDPKLNKTALGSLTSVAWEQHPHPLGFASRLKKQGIRLIVMENDTRAPSVFSAAFIQDSCLVFGNEVQGVSRPMLKLADEVLRIPQFGKKESLNVAVAAGIAIYEFRRKSQISSANQG